MTGVTEPLGYAAMLEVYLSNTKTELNIGNLTTLSSMLFADRAFRVAYDSNPYTSVYISSRRYTAANGTPPTWRRLLFYTERSHCHPVYRAELDMDWIHSRTVLDWTVRDA